ncbi:SHOCT domain-containing protein [Nocardia amamiensis]|uniref:SHOCT domain-containing protein n=1 Tax=Nocardia amamiensis TaxID=404578 RepID=A0ABS0CQW5_9NOCA|nr:SHOCT domain-containing protein [Nocardia amamiensis]MBF6299007.1 SHOCT domain-containing protein [Nocardia amamiensis]
MMFWYGDEGMSGWDYGLMTVGMVVFWVLVIGGVILTVRYLAQPSAPVGGAPIVRPSAEQVLAERFARGEIDADEYHHRLATLRGDIGSGAGPKSPGDG